MIAPRRSASPSATLPRSRYDLRLPHSSAKTERWGSTSPHSRGRRESRAAADSPRHDARAQPQREGRGRGSLRRLRVPGGEPGTVLAFVEQHRGDDNGGAASLAAPELPTFTLVSVVPGRYGTRTIKRTSRPRARQCRTCSKCSSVGTWFANSTFAVAPGSLRDGPTKTAL